jgi:hypothetical protein
MTNKSAAVAALPPQPWAFHYAGPLFDEPDFSCVTCLAGKQKKCPSHGTGYAQGCAHCLAAQGGACHAHWGLDAAWAHFLGEVCAPGSVPDAKTAIALAQVDLGQLGAESARQITIDLKGTGAGSLSTVSYTHLTLPTM